MSGGSNSNGSGGGGSGGSSKFSLCQASSFCADNELLTIVPSFTYRGRIPFMSWTTTSSSTTSTSNNKGKTNDAGNSGGGGYVVGPFVSGVPTEVPLWVAKTLHSRRLAQVDVPDWLTPQRLKIVIKEERTSPLLSKSLPFYYYEISLALKWLVDPQCQVLLQDLSSLRLDKLRQNFQEISRDTLEEPQGLVGDDDEEDDEEDGYYGNNRNKTNNSNDENGAGRDVLPTIDITGIASYELNKVGPFFQRAFSDYGYLTTRMSERLYEKYHVDHDDEDEEEDERNAEEEEEEDDIPTRMEDEDEDFTEEHDHEGYGDDDDYHTGRSGDKGAAAASASASASAASGAAGGGGTARRIVGGRSRLRRFR